MRNYIHSDSKECQAHYSCEKLHCIPFVECSLLKITSTSLLGAVQNLHNTFLLPNDILFIYRTYVFPCGKGALYFLW